MRVSRINKPALQPLSQRNTVRVQRGLRLAARVRGPADRRNLEAFQRHVLEAPTHTKRSVTVMYSDLRRGLSPQDRAWLDAAYGRTTGYVPGRRSWSQQIAGHFTWNEHD